MMYPCPTAFYRPELSVKIKNESIKESWEKLGKKVSCIACGGSDESTTLLALKFEDLIEASSRLFKDSFSRKV